MLGFARPYVGLIVIALVLTLTFAGGRYVRAYLIKPLLDEVLLPSQYVVSETVREETSWLSISQWTGSEEARPTPERAAPPPPNAEATRSIEEIKASFRWVIGAALAIIVVMPFVLFARYYMLQFTLGRISIDIKRALAAKLLLLPLSFHRQTRTGDTLTRALNDATASERALKLMFGDFLQAGAMVVAGVTTLLLISWQLTLVALLVGPVVAGVVAFFARRIRQTARRRQEQLGEVTQRLVDILSGIKVIKAFRGEDLENEAFRREAEKLFRRNMKVVKNRVISRSLVEGLNGATGVGMLALGAYLVMRGMWDITPGDVAAFATVLATTYRPVKTLSRGWAQLSESLSSAERFFHLIDLDAEPADPPGAITIDGVHDSIRFEGLGFRYGDEEVIRDVDLEVKAGEIIAVVGRSGEGKSTLMDLMLRFYDPSAGCIRFDGVDIREIARSSLLEQIAIVTQEPFLFDTSVAENIRYGRPDASHEEMLDAARSARVDEFIDQLPEGFDTEVGEFGLRLSGGQRQRITIARALLKNPAILVFDEATSALDVQTEQSVQDAIESQRGRRTLFVVAHRLSTIKRADRIVVMKKGQICQLGSHEELIDEPGLYRDFVTLQQEG
jgi:ABC-type multidrug transport system fused ATPase/permease subunit